MCFLIIAWVQGLLDHMCDESCHIVIEMTSVSKKLHEPDGQAWSGKRLLESSVNLSLVYPVSTVGHRQLY